MDLDSPNTKVTYSVCGLLVHVRPEKAQEVAEKLKQFASVEVHAVSAEGKLVVTIEEEDNQQLILDRIETINNTEGVINTSLVYNENELSEEAGESLEDQS